MNYAMKTNHKDLLNLPIYRAQRNPETNMTLHYVLFYFLLWGKAVLSIVIEPLQSRQGEHSG